MNSIHLPGTTEKWLARLRQSDLSSVFMTLGDNDTSDYPQFLSAITFESQCLIEDGATVDLSQDLRHADG